MQNIYFKDFINGVSVQEFLTELNEIQITDSTDFINIYVDSPGGEIRGAIAMIDAINNHDYKENIIMSSLSTLCSAATDLFLLTNTYKRILDPYMTCMFHIPSIQLEYRETIRKDSEEIFLSKMLKEQEKNYISKLKSWGLTPKEIDTVVYNKDFWFDAGRLLKICHILKHKIMT